jgi:hypothetical protein
MKMDRNNGVFPLLCLFAQRILFHVCGVGGEWLRLRDLPGMALGKAVVLRTIPHPSQKTRRMGHPVFYGLGFVAYEIALEGLLQGDGGWAGCSDVLEEAVLAGAVGPGIGRPDVAGCVDCDSDFAGGSC